MFTDIYLLCCMLSTRSIRVIKFVAKNQYWVWFSKPVVLNPLFVWFSPIYPVCADMHLSQTMDPHENDWSSLIRAENTSKILLYYLLLGN